MSDKTFRCKLITPAAQVLDEDVTYASVPAWDGLFGVLAGRAPIVAKLGIGELKVRGQGEKSFLIEEGFAQMVENRLTILTSRAIPVTEIDAAQAQSELAEAEARTVPADHPHRSAELEKVSKDRRRAQAKVRLAGRR